jgi:hypothetical protein
MTRSRSVAFFMGIAALFAATCTNDQLAGPSSEGGNPQIVAVVVDNTKHPVTDASIYVYQMAANFDSTSQPDSAGLVRQLRTDANGKCSIDQLIPGTYSLMATDSAKVNSTIKTNIPITLSKPEKPEYKDTLVLAAPGGIHGVVSRGRTVSNQNLKDGFIQVKIGELDRSTLTGPDGKYSFANLPAAVYTVYYYATDGFYVAKRENIIVSPGKDTAIDTVILKSRLLPPPQEFTAVYDTAAGMVRFHWSPVVFEGFLYYMVQRRCSSQSAFDKSFNTVDTALVDTLGTIPTGTVLYYVVRSVDKIIRPSDNAGGPIEITVTRKQ